MTHLETFATKGDEKSGDGSGDGLGDGSGDEFDVPFSQIIHDHERWGAPFEAAASAAIAKAFNDRNPQTVHWTGAIAVATLTQKALHSLSECSVRSACAALLTRYCANAHKREAASVPPPSSSVALKPGADVKEPPPPPHQGKPAQSSRRLDPSDTEDDDDDDGRAPRPAPAVPASLSKANRKRPAAAEEEANGRATAKPAAAAAPPVAAVHKRKKPRGLDDSSDADEASSSSSVAATSEEEDESSKGDDSDREPEDGDDEEEDEAAAEPVPPPKARTAPLAAAAYQVPSHVPDAQRFLDVIDAHRSSFSTTRCEAMERDACAITLSANPAPGVAEAAAYNRLLGHALSCLEDLLEERRPDHCVLMPRAEALAARAAVERATQLCEATLPQLDDAIAKLQALRDQGSRALLGVADDLPPVAEAATANGRAANGAVE